MTAFYLTQASTSYILQQLKTLTSDTADDTYRYKAKMMTGKPKYSSLGP